MRILLALQMGLLVLAQSALAGPVSFGFSSGTRSATVEFSSSGSDLFVTLTNTSPFDALVPTDILTAVFFELDGNPALTRVSAFVPLSSSVLVGNSGANVTPGDRVVGGEWSYLNSISDPANHNQGISSTGVGTFGPGNRFPGANLQGPTSPNGVQYGITSAGDNFLTGNGGLSGEHLILNSVVFKLSGFSGEPNAVITAARFLYGTSLDEPQFEGTLVPVPPLVPEPSTYLMAAMGLIALLFARRRT
jgi:hypothetical protein